MEEKIGSPATKAKNKYNAKVYDRLHVSVPKGKKEELQTHAQNKGESLNGFINRAINETVERDSSSPTKDSPLKE